MAKFHSGVAPLHIETGGGERVCFTCPCSVENELHVPIQCPVYNDLRDEMFGTTAHVCNNLNEMSDDEKLCFILSN